MSNEKSIGSRILGMFVETEQTPATDTPAQKVPVPVQVSPSHTVVTDDSTTEMKNDAIEIFKGVIQNRKTPYTAIIEKTSVLSDIIPNEQDRIKAALKLVIAEGRSVDSVIQSIDMHIADVQNTVVNLRETSKEVSKSKVDSARTEANFWIEQQKKNSDKITELLAEIEKLKEHSLQSAEKSAQLSKQADDEEKRIEAIIKINEQIAESTINDLVSFKQTIKN
jgi:hypothetical protein